MPINPEDAIRNTRAAVTRQESRWDEIRELTGFLREQREENHLAERIRLSLEERRPSP